MELPKLPVFDLWEKLKEEKRPIVIYGMGNGADKLIARLDSLGIRFADIFASDGFVRGHSFHGIRVKTLSEIETLYGDFVVLLSFASRLDEVIDMILAIARKHELYIPDMPVSEEEVYFDSAFFSGHYSEIKEALSCLEDEKSKNTFISIIRYKLSGRIEDLLESCASKEEMYELLRRREIRNYIDVGAYSGDTLFEAMEFLPTLKKAVCIEPDRRTFGRLSRKCEEIKDIELKLVNAAAWSSCGRGDLSSSSNRNTTVLGAATASYGSKTESVELIKVDALLESADYIKYDVEGSEREALIGSRETIQRSRPALLVSLYHKSRDIFELVNLLHTEYPDYKMHLLRLRCLPAWEINLIMLPR